MNITSETVAWHQAKYGIPPGTPYDPDLHAGIPAICFGPLLEDDEELTGQHLRPELDLFAQMKEEDDE